MAPSTPCSWKTRMDPPGRGRSQGSLPGTSTSTAGLAPAEVADGDLEAGTGEGSAGERELRGDPATIPAGIGDDGVRRIRARSRLDVTSGSATARAMTNTPATAARGSTTDRAGPRFLCRAPPRVMPGD